MFLCKRPCPRYAETSAEHEAAYDALLTGRLFAMLQLLAPEVHRRGRLSDSRALRLQTALKRR